MQLKARTAIWEHPPEALPAQRAGFPKAQQSFSRSGASCSCRLIFSDAPFLTLTSELLHQQMLEAVKGNLLLLPVGNTSGSFSWECCSHSVMYCFMKPKGKSSNSWETCLFLVYGLSDCEGLGNAAQEAGQVAGTRQAGGTWERQPSSDHEPHRVGASGRSGAPPALHGTQAWSAAFSSFKRVALRCQQHATWKGGSVTWSLPSDLSFTACSPAFNARAKDHHSQGS